MVEKAKFVKNNIVFRLNDSEKIEIEVRDSFTFTEDYFTKDETPNFVAYETFIQNYKPLVKRTLSKEIAQQWLEQANEVIQMIEGNIQ